MVDNKLIQNMFLVKFMEIKAEMETIS